MAATAADLVDLARTGIAFAQGKASAAEVGVTAAGVGIGLWSLGGGYGRASRAALEAGLRGATNVAEQVAFQALSGGVRAGAGVVIAGGGNKNAFRAAGDFAKRYGGDAADYVKKATRESVTSAGGSKVHQLHWVENVQTGQIFDVKLTTQAVGK